MAAGFLITGCSTVERGHCSNKVQLEKYQTAYVVMVPGTHQRFGPHIVEALAQHGVKAVAGPLENKPTDVGFFVTHEDHWRWDLSMYLFSLDIHFIDNKTSNEIGSGSFHQGGFHSFPDPRKKTFAVIDSIYDAR